MYRLISGIFLIFVYKRFCIDILWYIMYSSTTLCDEVCQWPAAGRRFSLINLSQPVLSRERRRVAYEQGDRTRQSTSTLLASIYFNLTTDCSCVGWFCFFFFLFFFWLNGSSTHTYEWLRNIFILLISYSMQKKLPRWL
jgi:hypothetical protein